MTTDVEIEVRNPLAIRSGADKGKLPHELDENDFLVWKIEQGMTDEDYATSLSSCYAFVANWQNFGKPIPTRQLDSDQRGWANADHRLHYEFNFAKWFVNPDKPSKPFPALTGIRRHREYSDTCTCKKRDQDWEIWGKRYDGKQLLQCDNCGEVFLNPYKED